MELELQEEEEEEQLHHTLPFPSHLLHPFKYVLGVISLLWTWFHYVAQAGPDSVLGLQVRTIPLTERLGM